MEANKTCCNKKELVSNGLGYIKKFIDYKRSKNADNINMARVTQIQIIQELKRTDLSREERNRLIEILENITPDEAGLLAISKGTTVAKISVVMISATLIMYFHSKKARKG